MTFDTIACFLLELFILVSWCCHWVVFCCSAPSFTHALNIDIQYSTPGPFPFNAARNREYKIWTKWRLPTEDIANWHGQFSVILDAVLEFSKMLQASTKWLGFAHEKTRFPWLSFTCPSWKSSSVVMTLNSKNPCMHSSVSSTSHSVWRTWFGLGKYLRSKC